MFLSFIPIVFIFTCITFLPWVFPIVIDDFIYSGLFNKIGLQRKFSAESEYTALGLSIPPGMVFYEQLAPVNDPMDLTGKVIEITYSTELNEDRILRLQNDQESDKPITHIITLDLEVGMNNKVRLLTASLGNVDLSHITRMEIIGGALTLREIQIVDDASSKKKVSTNPFSLMPANLFSGILIDDFSDWNESINYINGGTRILSETAETGPGYVNLMNENDVLIQYFSTDNSPIYLENTNFRLQYSANTFSHHIITLIHQSADGNKEMSLCSVQLPTGSFQETTVPASLFQSPNPQLNTMHAIGIMFKGPLVLHQMHMFVSKQDFNLPFFPDNNALPIHVALNFIRKVVYLRNVLQLIRVPKTFLLGVDKRHVFRDAMDVMDIASFRMDLDVYFHYIRRNTKRHRLRQFYKRLFYDMGSGSLGLFDPMFEYNRSLRITPRYDVSPSLLQRYRFAGRMIGMAIINKEMKSLNFAPMVYRILLNKPLLFGDMLYIEPSEYTKVRKHLDSTYDGALTMSITSFNHVTNEESMIDLIPYGRDIFVTKQNLLVYTDAVLNWYTAHLINAQAQALREGLYEVIPLDLLNILDESELEHLLSGCPEGHKFLPRLGSC